MFAVSDAILLRIGKLCAASPHQPSVSTNQVCGRFTF